MYVKQEWVDGSTGETPISAARLNHMEDGIANAVTVDAPQVSDDFSGPMFSRVNGGAPVLTVAAQNPAPGAATPTTSPSLYFPSIIDARAVLGGSALDEFYMWDSTDHEATHANSGIWLRTAPTELGPWTSRGRVYIDNVSGSQTETPAVFPNPAGSGLIMLYQQGAVSGAVGTQTTMAATSPDGVTWTRVGIAIDINPATPGDGHTGYARVTRIGGMVYAHHLRGGGDFPHFGLSASSDGLVFSPIGMCGYEFDQFTDGRRIEWNSGDVVLWQGQLWWVGICSNFVSGSAAKDARIAVAPITADLMHLVGRPRYVLFPAAGGETTNYRSTRAFVGRDGRLYLYFQCGNSYYAAVAEV